MPNDRCELVSPFQPRRGPTARRHHMIAFAIEGVPAGPVGSSTLMGVTGSRQDCIQWRNVIAFSGGGPHW